MAGPPVLACHADMEIISNPGPFLHAHCSNRQYQRACEPGIRQPNGLAEERALASEIQRQSPGRPRLSPTRRPYVIDACSSHPSLMGPADFQRESTKSASGFLVAPRRAPVSVHNSNLYELSGEVRGPIARRRRSSGSRGIILSICQNPPTR